MPGSVFSCITALSIYSLITEQEDSEGLFPEAEAYALSAISLPLFPVLVLQSSGV